MKIVRAARWLAWVLAVAWVGAAGPRPLAAEGLPAPEPTPTLEGGPELRVLLYTGPGPVEIGGGPGPVEIGGGPGPVEIGGGPGPGARLQLHPPGPGAGSVRWEILPVEGRLTLAGRPYRGWFEVFGEGTQLQVINRVPLEDYLLGVVPRELLVEEQEAVKAQAVLARSYALSRRQGSEVRFDLTDDTRHQVYGGVAVEDPRSDRAVRLTRGEVLTFQGRLADHPLYHSTCGGHTEANEDVFGSDPVPYLRAVPCLDPQGSPWCGRSLFAAWTRGWGGASLEDRLARQVGRPLGSLQQVRSLGEARGGRVLALEFSFEGEERVVLKGTELRSLLPADEGPLPSTRFRLAPQADRGAWGARPGAWVLSGSGWGHGVGMCQWGAVGRARAGASYPEILEAYFPGALVQPGVAQGKLVKG